MTQLTDLTDLMVEASRKSTEVTALLHVLLEAQQERIDSLEECIQILRARINGIESVIVEEDQRAVRNALRAEGKAGVWPA
jgi:dihydroxyacetone kinase